MHLLLCELNNVLLKHPDLKGMFASEVGVDTLLLPQVQH